MTLKSLVLALAGTAVLAGAAAGAKLPVISKDPYVGAIALDASTGQVLFESNADAKAYPASCLKLMNMLILQEKIEQGALKLTDTVTATAEASKIGGSQVYLKEHEIFSVEDLLYALMIQSANDAATALAIHVGGSKDGFVQMMNERAAALGMKDTHFNSVHGLPPSEGQQPDVTTVRDFSRLCLELCKHPDVFKYTSTKTRGFRQDTFGMQNHNKMLWTFPGCDGFKTGYYTAAGYSIAATATRNGARVIAVVLGSRERTVRDAKAAELLSKAFLAAPRPAAPATPAAPAAAAAPTVSTNGFLPAINRR